MPAVALVAGSRQTRISVRRRKASSPPAPWKVSTPGERLRRPAPAGDAKAEPVEHRGRIATELAEAHHSDRHLAGRRLVVLVPAPLALLRVIAALPAMMHQHVQRDVFGHPHREVGIDDAHERHLRQLRSPSR